MLLCPHAQCLDALMITCSHAPMLLCSHVLTWLVVTCVHGSSYSSMLTFGCSLYWLLTCLDVHMLECSRAHMLWWSHALMITCSQAHMPCWSNATMPHVLTITCSYAHIHWYSPVWYPYTCAHTWLMICLYAWRTKWSCSCTFVRSNALTIVHECRGD